MSDSLVAQPLLFISDKALLQLNKTAQKEGVDLSSTYLRVSVIPGGCSGLTYDLGWDSSRTDLDAALPIGTFTVLVDERSAAYLEGTTLDFSDGLEGKGFHFSNPQAIRNCACGESFGL